MKLVPGSASQVCLFHKVLARAWRCQGLPSPENEVIEQQNADNELLCLCCLFVITHVFDQNIKTDKVLVQQLMSTLYCIYMRVEQRQFAFSMFRLSMMSLLALFVNFTGLEHRAIVMVGR